MAHLSPLQLVQVMEAGHVIATQRDQAITERDHAQEQGQEWERAARGSAEEAVAWRSKAQAVADELMELATSGTQADELRTLAGRIYGTGRSLPSDGQLVNVVPMETVKVGNKL